jgi:hypothetical protein
MFIAVESSSAQPAASGSMRFFAGYLSVGLGAQGWMVMSSFSVVLWVMQLVSSVAEGVVRAVEGF